MELIEKIDMYLNEGKEEDNHEKYLMRFKKIKDDKKECDKLHKKYKKEGLMLKSVSFDEWKKYMMDELKARE